MASLSERIAAAKGTRRVNAIPAQTALSERIAAAVASQEKSAGVPDAFDLSARLSAAQTARGTPTYTYGRASVKRLHRLRRRTFLRRRIWAAGFSEH